MGQTGDHIPAKGILYRVGHGETGHQGHQSAGDGSLREQGGAEETGQIGQEGCEETAENGNGHPVHAQGPREQEAEELNQGGDEAADQDLPESSTEKNGEPGGANGGGQDGPGAGSRPSDARRETRLTSSTRMRLVS